MAFMYVVAYHDPNQIGHHFPPSVTTSDWAIKIAAWHRNDSPIGPLSCSFIFDTEEELRSFILDNQLTDPELIADIEAWHAAHGVYFTKHLYEITPSSIEIPRFINESLG